MFKFAQNKMEKIAGLCRSYDFLVMEELVSPFPIVITQFNLELIIYSY